ncbi:MAG: hypothetical protein AAB873_02100 [Patescibacteria group bacterium]|mgnify:CR=1 FL=1
MAFTEKLKLEIKKNANFRCCRCYEIGVDIHHIIPQAQNGIKGDSHHKLKGTATIVLK